MNRRVLLKCAFFLIPLLLCYPSSGFAEEAKISVSEHLFYPPESKGIIYSAIAQTFNSEKIASFLEKNGIILEEPEDEKRDGEITTFKNDEGWMIVSPGYIEYMSGAGERYSELLGYLLTEIKAQNMRKGVYAWPLEKSPLEDADYSESLDFLDIEAADQLCRCTLKGLGIEYDCVLLESYSFAQDFLDVNYQNLLADNEFLEFGDSDFLDLGGAYRLSYAFIWDGNIIYSNAESPLLNGRIRGDELAQPFYAEFLVNQAGVVSLKVENSIVISGPLSTQPVISVDQMLRRLENYLNHEYDVKDAQIKQIYFEYLPLNDENGGMEKALTPAWAAYTVQNEYIEGELIRHSICHRINAITGEAIR